MQKLSALLGKFPRWTALVAGAASAYGFEPWGLWPLTLICFALLIQLISRSTSTKGAFMLGWLFGVGHFTFGNQWIAVAFTFQAAMPIWLGYVAVFGLALYLAVYPALAAAGAHWINHRTTNALRDSGGDDEKPRPTATLHLILAFAGLWIITEWLRSWVFTGYVWNPLSVVTLSIPYLSQPATALGTYGLSGFMLLVVGMILKFVTLWTSVSGVERGDGGRTDYFLGGLILFALAAVAITGRSSFDQSAPDRTPVALTIAQPNISQADKYAPGYDAINFAKLAMNSRPMPDQGARLILWPEAAIPDYLEEGYPYRYYQGQPDESAFGARARLTTLMGDGDVLVTGANRLVIEKGQLVAARNSVSAMDA
ncbi:apolipoprotein N-acyltransferase, partial [Sphingorhabdus sp.]|uniref:apolipoprotein N-acyltransferase n=1 Tax=Sphingorhabdus sp. TaxID=1902408 RepID=UPI003783DA01